MNTQQEEMWLITGAKNVAALEELALAFLEVVFGFRLIRKGLMVLIDNFLSPQLYLFLFLAASPYLSHTHAEEADVFEEIYNV